MRGAAQSDLAKTKALVRRANPGYAVEPTGLTGTEPG